MRGRKSSITTSKPCERVFRRVRAGRSRYAVSIELLRRAKEMYPDGLTKSGLMVGLGETPEEIVRTMRDLRGAEVDILTIGQYLRPTPKHVADRPLLSPG